MRSSRALTLSSEKNIQHHFKDLNEGLYIFEPVGIRQKPKLI